MRKSVCILLCLFLLISALPALAETKTALGGYSIDSDTGYVTGVKSDVTAKEFIATAAESGIILKKGDKTLSETELVGTGTVVELDKSSYTVCILGDLDGSGTIQAKDYLMLKRVVLGTYTLQGVALAACKISGGTPAAKDYLMLKRHVLGSYNIYGESNPVVLRFAAMSDNHFEGNGDTVPKQRLSKALSYMYNYSASQSYKGFDALLVAGDMSSYGSANEFSAFKSAVDSGLKGSTQLVACMGNHEFYGGNIANAVTNWEKVYGKADTHTVINGYHFVSISTRNAESVGGDFSGQLKWLEAELAKAAADDPKKPIFVMQHLHIQDTVYGSGDWGTSALTSILKKYPQIINFSGHSHYPINDPRSIWQGSFTAVGCGTMKYFELEGGKIDGNIPANADKAAQFWVVEVRADNSVTLKPYDVISGTYFNDGYTVQKPYDKNSFIYTNDRSKTAVAPVFASDAKVTATKVGTNYVELSFPQATDDELVHSYKLTLTPASGTKSSFLTFSQFYFADMPKTISRKLEGLLPDTEYTLTVTALDSFGKESAPISVKFTTEKSNDKPIDKTSDIPEADLLSLTFKNGKAVDESRSDRSVGGGASIGNGYADFNGSNGLIVPFKVSSTVNNSVCIMQTLSVSEWYNYMGYGYTDTMGCMQSGGYGFELDNNSKTIAFWCSINGSYVVPTAKIELNTVYTVAGVYDGKNVMLYINGKLADSKPASGKITYPDISASHAMAIGADISESGNIDACFSGRVYDVKAYSYAPTAKQIENIYNSIKK